MQDLKSFTGILY